MSYFHEGSPGAQQAAAESIGLPSSGAVVDPVKSAEDHFISVHARVDPASARGFGRCYIGVSLQNVIGAQTLRHLLARFLTGGHPDPAVRLYDLQGLYDAKADHAAAVDQDVLPFPGRIQQNGVDGHAGRLQKHGLILRQFVKNFGELLLRGQEGITESGPCVGKI